jgi:hypothetical protein
MSDTLLTWYRRGARAADATQITAALGFWYTMLNEYVFTDYSSAPGWVLLGLSGMSWWQIEARMEHAEETLIPRYQDQVRALTQEMHTFSSEDMDMPPPESAGPDTRLPVVRGIEQITGREEPSPELMRFLRNGSHNSP